MEGHLRIAICEDQPEDAKRLLELIKSCPIDSECTCFSSGEELLAAFAPGKFDLLLSDILMGGISGVEAVTKIRTMDSQLPVAFLTTSQDFALEGYRLKALRYLEKPVKRNDVCELLNFGLLEKENQPSLTIQKNGAEQRIPYAKILYLEQQGRQLVLHLSDGSTLEIYEKLSDLMPELEIQDFFQTHKSYTVNLAHVLSLDRELRCFRMTDQSMVPIRRENLSRAKKSLEFYLFQSVREGMDS